MVILYARVSTMDQAERDLSIPAQLRALKKLAATSGYTVAAEFQDIASGTTFRNRPGLLAALSYATHHRVEALLVHRLDRLARNTYHYLTIRARLHTAGVRIVSFVEHFDEGPLGALLENIMAAMSEFYSANLSMEVTKSIEERHARGLWPAGTPPLGYIMRRRRIVPDPARASHVRYACERWATGTTTTSKLAHEMHSRGLVNNRGKFIQAKRWCEILKNPIYAGFVQVNGTTIRAQHEALISQETHVACLKVFEQRQRKNVRTTIHLFPLRGRLHCQRCGRSLVGEVHTKPSGRVYRYYRCHGRGCHVLLRADEAEVHAKFEVFQPGVPGHVSETTKKTATKPSFLKESGVQLVPEMLGSWDVVCNPETWIGNDVAG